MEHRMIDITLLDPNEGQMEGLPSNPRKWSKDELERLCRSIEETPELLEARGIIVVPHGGRYIVLGGNMRVAALRELGHTEAPCIVLPKSTHPDKLREIVIKDNGSFGHWETAMLEAEWSGMALSDWGVEGFADSPNSEDFGDTFSLRSEEKTRQQMTFTFSCEQAEKIKSILEQVKKSDCMEAVETFGNENNNGNAVYMVFVQWEEQRKLS